MPQSGGEEEIVDDDECVGAVPMEEHQGVRIAALDPRFASHRASGVFPRKRASSAFGIRWPRPTLT